MNKDDETLQYFKRLAVDLVAGKLPRHGLLYLLETDQCPVAGDLESWFCDWLVHHFAVTYTDQQKRGVYLFVDEGKPCAQHYLLRNCAATQLVLVFEPKFTPFAKRNYGLCMLCTEHLPEYTEFCLRLGLPGVPAGADIPTNREFRLGQAAVTSLTESATFLACLTDVVYEVLEITNDCDEIPEIDDLVGLALEVLSEQVKYRGGLDVLELCVESAELVGGLYAGYSRTRALPIRAVRNAVALYKARIDPAIL